MATFGQGVNPQLGAIDYSAFSRGAAQQAQGVMMGGQGIAQGIAQVGQQIGGAIQEYNQKKEQKLKLEKAIGAFTSFANSNPDMAKNLGLQKDSKTGTWDKKAISHVIESLGGAGAALGVASQLEQAKQQADMDQQKLAIAKKQAQDERIRLSIMQMQAMAKAANSKPKGVSMSLGQIARLKDQGLDATGVPTEDGNVLVSSVSPFAPGAPKPYRSPREEADAAGMAAESKAEADSAVAFLDGVGTAAEAADNALTKYSEVEDLLDRDTTKTGFGQETLTGVRSAMARIFPDRDLKDQQQLEALLAEDGLIETRTLLKGQGAVSNAERDRIDRVALNAKKDKNSLKELLRLRKAAAQRALAAQEVRVELETAGLGARDIKKKLNSWYKDNPFSAFIPASGFDFSEANSIIAR
jgi:hypothetical protein